MKDILIIFLVCILNIICYAQGVKKGIKYAINKSLEIFAKGLKIKFDKENKPENEQIEFVKDLSNILEDINVKDII